MQVEAGKNKILRVQNFVKLTEKAERLFFAEIADVRAEEKDDLFARGFFLEGFQRPKIIAVFRFDRKRGKFAGELVGQKIQGFRRNINRNVCEIGLTGEQMADKQGSFRAVARAEFDQLLRALERCFGLIQRQGVKLEHVKLADTASKLGGVPVEDGSVIRSFKTRRVPVSSCRRQFCDAAP